MRRPNPSDESRGGGAPTVTAVLEDGPLRGTRIDAEVIEGRPPKTLDVDGGSDGTLRYVLSEWVQEGPTASYSFLYRV
jgi:hypothetical protein